MTNIVAIVGRPNVGKSTLFNRLTQTRTAIVDEISGVTRDRNYDRSEWNGQEFSVIDTGGYVQNSGDIFEEEIRKQVFLAIEESDIILFLVDVENGITDLDQVIARMLRKTDKKVIPVVNKVDNAERLPEANIFYKLGMGDLFESANKGSPGASVFEQEVFTQDQLERIVEILEPFAKKGRLLGLIDGNHELREYKLTGLNLTKTICKLSDMKDKQSLVGLSLNDHYVHDDDDND